MGRSGERDSGISVLAARDDDDDDDDMLHVIIVLFHDRNFCNYIYILKYVGPRRDLYFFELFILFLHACYIRVCFQLVVFIREHIWHKALLMGYSMRVEITLTHN